ncbi:MAG TPA: 5'-nucleotidase C-terminal domain-containing protein [Flexivirga sp.]|uniref:bifunctional metallophosphatase/5'-nucleotidase n=1 Tax=Flexivirga sp. TaxID=1962927 RepID=UPI002C6236C3|nr:5'-nucleotidase C-terminal domain-containing protein [Flexivirga sp.]HWC23229.1 5'-nucleotidase C-terminal domain-containing protein [Flexivirga sp.]
MHPVVRNATSRRQLLAMTMIGGAGVVGVAKAPSAAAAPDAAHDLRLTVLGTTDLHGHVYNWDYFSDKEYDDKAHNDVGAAKCATLIQAVREERGADTCITLDAGDTIQGTPLAYYYAKIEPIGKDVIHPMALAMNQIGYDAAALGNHEFNYGMDLLRTFQSQLHHPLLGANALDWNTGKSAFPAYTLKRVYVPGHKPVTVGIVGLVTPGVAIWDKANVQDKVKFNGIVEQAKLVIPEVKAQGADVIVVSCHSGADTSSSYGDALPYPENASTLLAQQVPDIDAILVGHAHVEIPQRFVTNEQIGKQVLLSEPLCFGERVTVMDLNLRKNRGQWEVASAASTLLNSNTAPEDPTIADLLRTPHEKVRTYVNGVIGTCVETMSGARACVEDAAAVDFINLVQAQAVKAGLAGTPDEATPVLSIAAPFSRTAIIPKGDVTVRDVAGLYIYDNTLLGIKFTGQQVKAYLETSATYFQQVSGAGPFDMDQVTNAKTPTAPNGTPDYNYDVMGGLDAALTYDIDLSVQAGSRIRNLAYDGKPVADGDSFVIAINNYRQSGGGGFPGVTTAPVVYNRQNEIRQLIIDWVTANKSIDPATFHQVDWKLVSGSTPIVVN